LDLGEVAVGRSIVWDAFKIEFILFFIVVLQLAVEAERGCCDRRMCQ
jgi:hypothetical protein